MWESRNLLNYLYQTHIEKVFGKAGARTLGIQDVIHFAEDLKKKGLVHHRCVSFLRQHPFLEFITQHPLYYKIIQRENVNVLEAGSFLGNEIRRFYKDRFGGHVIGIDKNPWHLLVGFLLHNDSPDNYDLIVGDVCDMTQIFKDSQFEYIYSPGMIHSLMDTNRVVIFLTEAYRVMKRGGYLFGSAISSRDVGLEMIDHDFVLLTPEQLRTYLSAAGFKEIYIKEIRTFRKGIHFVNIFECQK